MISVYCMWRTLVIERISANLASICHSELTFTSCQLSPPCLHLWTAISPTIQSQAVNWQRQPTSWKKIFSSSEYLPLDKSLQHSVRKQIWPEDSAGCMLNGSVSTSSVYIVAIRVEDTRSVWSAPQLTHSSSQSSLTHHQVAFQQPAATYIDHPIPPSFVDAAGGGETEK